ncbi:MAG: pyridoxine 5'-phosphate synthase [Acidobacteria bacterium]|nr:pyridoxine 5'-phosphate synthase [Acidobacteriota bacterium]
MAEPVLLGVNIDHVATVRQARPAPEPDPIHAAVLAELGGADGITVHLRSDRRHIQDRDVELLAQMVKTHLNVEMAATDEMLQIALALTPHAVCLVPERPDEVTTEGGLDVAADPEDLGEHVQALQDSDIDVTLFIDPDVPQVEAAASVDADQIEINTAAYAEATEQRDIELIEQELARVAAAAAEAAEQGLRVAAGHGLTYRNVGPIVAIEEIVELNIGHNIVARATLVGMELAVREMKALLDR